MDNTTKINQLRDKLNNKLNPDVIDYVHAELDYISEIDNGYDRRDLLKSEQRLISAINRLLK